MRIKGKRIFNHRPMLFFALFLTFGIIFSEALYGASMWWYFGLLLLFIIAFLLVAIFKNPENLSIFHWLLSSVLLQ